MNERRPEADPDFERRARELLERSVDSLPATTRSRLTRARYAALGQRPGRAVIGDGGAARWRRWLPAAGAAGVVLAMLLMLDANRNRPMPLPAAVSGDDLALLADRDALAIAQDQAASGVDVDYEFYDWAVNAAQDEAAGPVGS